MLLSFLYAIRDTKSDLYMDKRDYIYLFDTSDYPQIIFFIQAETKKKLGKFKDETTGSAIERFCGLRSKLYVYKVVNKEEEVKKAKGVLHVLYYGTGNDFIVMHDGVHCTAIASSEKGGISRLILNIE